MAKEISDKNVQFAKGGKGKMFGQQGANPQRSGESGHAAADGVGGKFAKGGSGKMFGFRPSAPARAGQSGPA
jgi:hypothetical protein